MNCAKVSKDENIFEYGQQMLKEHPGGKVISNHVAVGLARTKEDRQTDLFSN